MSRPTGGGQQSGKVIHDDAPVDIVAEGLSHEFGLRLIIDDQLPRIGQTDDLTLQRLHNRVLRLEVPSGVVDATTPEEEAKAEDDDIGDNSEDQHGQSAAARLLSAKLGGE